MSINHESLVVYGCRAVDYMTIGKGNVYFHDDIDVYGNILGFDVNMEEGCTLEELIDEAKQCRELFRFSGYNGELKFFLVEMVY